MSDQVKKLRAVLTGFGRDRYGSRLAHSVVLDGTGKIIWQTDRRRVQAVGPFHENGTIGALITQFPDFQFEVNAMIGSADRNFVELSIAALGRERQSS